MTGRLLGIGPYCLKTCNTALELDALTLQLGDRLQHLEQQNPSVHVSYDPSNNVATRRARGREYHTRFSVNISFVEPAAIAQNAVNTLIYRPQCGKPIPKVGLTQIGRLVGETRGVEHESGVRCGNSVSCAQERQQRRRMSATTRRDHSGRDATV